MKFSILAALLACFSSAGAESLIPTAEGTTWNYELAQEKITDSLDLSEPAEVEIIPVTYRLGGTEKVDNKELRRLEIFRGDVLDTVDLITIDHDGISCPARAPGHGNVVKLTPPQRMLAAPLAAGKHWMFDGAIGDTKVTQRYEVTGEEDLEVPAGKFHAWRIHCEQTGPTPATIDRWFVPGTGFVKVATVAKSESGAPAQRTWLSLKELPKFSPPKNAALTSDRFSAGVSSDPRGEFSTQFSNLTPTIYARWHGRGLRENAAIRAVFIAENVADVSADSQIDEMDGTTVGPNSGGSFELTRPDPAWTAGDYRIEFYLDGALSATVKFKIVK